MNNIQKRFLLFIFGCIAIRLYLTYLAKNASSENLQLFGYLALIPVFGWFYIIFIGERNTGGEVFGEQIWWKDLRFVHMMLWSCFSYMAINKDKESWKLLFGDTMLGLLAFLSYHYCEGNFRMLI